MHVVIIAASSYPIVEPFAGGLESLTWHLARGLRERDVDVTVFAAPGSDPGLDVTYLDVPPLWLSQVARTDVAMVPEAWLRTHHAYLQLMLSLRHRGDVDIVHNNSLHHLPVAMADSLPMPVLTTLHTPPTPWLEPAVDIATPRNGRTQNHFAAVSSHTARSWSHVTRARVVHNGIDVRRWTPGDGGTDLAWAGRIVPEKAPHRAVAMARSAGRRLRIAGPVGDRAYFEARIAPLLGPDVEYLGHLATHELVTLFGSSAVTLVTPEWDEPYGLVAAESLSCGTPVVALNRGGLGEFVHPGVGVLLPPGVSDQSAAQAVERAAGLDRAMCRAHAEASCSVSRMVDDYLSVYRSLIPQVGAA
ncbi:glycosyltransferase family 4 protein [Terrabacter terrigena]|uniref:Glycosyltransferase family 4 protein n=1 Tax=Terrabacter terrigena TaxID=574718 RepID=A0ABW3MVM9_9MICO